MIQLPGDIHRPAAGVFDIVYRPQEGIWRCADDVVFIFPDEKQHLAAPLSVVDISLANGAGVRRGGLALPVE